LVGADLALRAALFDGDVLVAARVDAVEVDFEGTTPGMVSVSPGLMD
jgi:hypothetical protein